MDYGSAWFFYLYYELSFPVDGRLNFRNEKKTVHSGTGRETSHPVGASTLVSSKPQTRLGHEPKKGPTVQSVA